MPLRNCSSHLAISDSMPALTTWPSVTLYIILFCTFVYGYSTEMENSTMMENLYSVHVYQEALWLFDIGEQKYG